MLPDKLSRPAIPVILCTSVLLGTVGLSLAGSYVSGLDQTIEIVNPAHGGSPDERIISFAMQGSKGGDGSIIAPYISYVNSVELSLTAAGIGQITVTDDLGHAVYSFAKTTADPEDLTFTMPLDRGVGLYEVTAVFSSLDDPQIVYGINRIYINFSPTTIIPEPPSNAPGTGMLYVGDRAYLKRDVYITVGFATVLATLAFVTLGASKKKQSRK
ncbi:hypothetical protein FWH13_00500 [Candidatus Saccharibacteria bacterium]|nr:hypothetical protein [Candidatus Saccharibacteria bacterium]